MAHEPFKKLFVYLFIFVASTELTKFQVNKIQ